MPLLQLNAAKIQAAIDSFHSISLHERPFSRMSERAKTLGVDRPEHYIWPACRWDRTDATQPIKKWDTAWRSLRGTAGLSGLRFHDLRHTIITELAEMGCPIT